MEAGARAMPGAIAGLHSVNDATGISVGHILSSFLKLPHPALAPYLRLTSMDGGNAKGL